MFTSAMSNIPRSPLKISILQKNDCNNVVYKKERVNGNQREKLGCLSCPTFSGLEVLVIAKNFNLAYVGTWKGGYPRGGNHGLPPREPRSNVVVARAARGCTEGCIGRRNKFGLSRSECFKESSEEILLIENQKQKPVCAFLNRRSFNFHNEASASTECVFRSPARDTLSVYAYPTKLEIPQNAEWFEGLL
jgi:hypothetical protein